MKELSGLTAAQLAVMWAMIDDPTARQTVLDDHPQMHWKYPEPVRPLIKRLADINPDKPAWDALADGRDSIARITAALAAAYIAAADEPGPRCGRCPHLLVGG